jgi:peroxiredoxin
MIRLTLIVIIIVSLTGYSFSQEELPKGTAAPNISATDHKGNKIELNELLEQGPVVLTFYRGEWCPHCNNYMKNLQDSLELIQMHNATVLAITPESDIYIDESIDKTGAQFSIIWGENHQIMDDYKVTFKLSGTKNTAYKVVGINVGEASGSGHRMLPVPATYIIGKDGKINGGFFNEDYSLRMPVWEILKVLENIGT